MDSEAGWIEWRTGVGEVEIRPIGLEDDSLVEIIDNPDTEIVEPGQVLLIDGHYTLIHDAVVRLDENPRRAEGGRPR